VAVADAQIARAQVVETSRALGECLGVLEVVEAKQEALVGAKASLEAERAAVVGRLAAREAELLRLKGLAHHGEETF